MSRRGRRRSSRRKSSSSSKQSASAYAYHKHCKSNSVSYNEIIEKGETDSFRKEIVLSGSDEEEDNEVPSKEKKFKPDDHLNSFQNQRNLSFTEPVDKDKGVKIVTSITIDDLKSSSPNITFQQSREPSSDDLANSTRAITNVTKVKCSGSCLKFEIQEFLQFNAAGIKTKFFIQNPKEDDTEACFERTCERIFAPDNKSFEQSSERLNAVDQDQKEDTITYNFTFGKTSEQNDAQENSKSSIPSCLTCRKSCCDNDREFTFTGWSSSPPSLSYVWSQGNTASVHKSSSSEKLLDIPPPCEFADSRCDILDDLTEDLASFMISTSNSGGKHQGGVSPPLSRMYNQESGCRNSLDEEECADMLAPCFEQLSESDNFEPMFMRPSLTVSRSGFTQDFINSHEGKMWVRNNSIATVEHKTCSLPTKRRRTFPGMSESPIQEGLSPYRESFSSGTISPFMMTSIPLQSDRLGRFCQGDDRLSPFGVESRKSSQSGASYKPSSGFSNSPIENQQLGNQFYPSRFEENPEDIFQTNKQFQDQSHQSVEDPRRPEMDLEDHCFEDMAGGEGHDGRDQVEQIVVAESGFDEEMGEVGFQIPGPIAEDLTQRDVIIQVIPPSLSGSEEQLLENNSTGSFQNRYTEVMAKQANQDGPDSEQPKLRKSSVLTIMVGESEQRFLQTDSKSVEGSSPETNQWGKLNTASEEPSVSPLVEMDEADFLSTIEVIEEVQPTTRNPLVPRTSISSPTLSQIVEEDPQFVRRRRGTEDLDISAMAASTLANVSADQAMESHRKERRQSVPKVSLAVKEHLKPSIHKDPDGSGSDHWAKRRKLFKESTQWSSAGGSSVTSDITEESASEETRSSEVTVHGIEDKGFYTETFHSAAWIYRGDDISSSDNPPRLTPSPRTVSIRERTVKISKGMGEYPWGFRIQYSKPIVVTEVDTNGAAEEAGLMVGDSVLAVNGTDVTSIPHSEAADLARQGPDLLTLTIGSDIAKSPNTPRPACRGYLHKRTQSGLIKGWRKRWFVLRHDCCLYYYRHKRDEGKQAVSAVRLEGAEVGPDTTLGKPFVFKCCPLPANRVYFFCATSNQEMKRWLGAMSSAVHPITQKHVWLGVTKHNSSLPPLAVKSPECLGLLHQIDKNKDVGIQHYCILKDACLYFYGGIRSTHALGGIYLHGYTVREQLLGSKKSTIELKPPSDEFKTFYLCAENPTENKRWIATIRASIAKWLPLHQAIQDYINRPPEETRM